jgi:hypothetical protein
MGAPSFWGFVARLVGERWKMVGQGRLDDARNRASELVIRKTLEAALAENRFDR